MLLKKYDRHCKQVVTNDFHYLLNIINGMTDTVLNFQVSKPKIINPLTQLCAVAMIL